MARYLVVHTPRVDDDSGSRPPTRLRELAEASRRNDGSPRWLRTWSPDLHDDRVFTMWEASSADEIRATLEEFGFLDDMDSTPLRVREWGPDDVLTSE